MTNDPLISDDVDGPLDLPDPRYRPETEADLEKMFETDGNLGAWHALCQSAGTPRARWKNTDFYKHGFERVPGLSSADAANVRAYLVECYAENRSEGVIADDDTEEVVASDADWVHRLLEKLLTQDIERRICGFFGSNFFIDYVQFTRTVPQDVHRPNRYWHRDGGPKAHIKIMVYFDDSTEHGSRTDFIDQRLTRAVGQAGYAFPQLKHRRTDLTPFTERAGKPFHFTHGDLAAGEQILFRPRDVLHRLILPERAERYALTLMIQPSPIPWRDAFEIWTCRPENLRTHLWNNAFFQPLATAANKPR